MLLKKISCATLLFLPLSTYAMATAATNVDKLVIFGDSLCDTGRVYAATKLAHEADPSKAIVPQSPPYYDGRFSNGEVWVEVLAKGLNLSPASASQFDNYAHGGAWVEPHNDIFPLDLTKQVALYAASSILDSKKNHLYVVEGGNNDYLEGRKNVEEATTKTIKHFRANVERLIKLGARHFLILNIVDLSETPAARASSPEVIANLKALTAAHNTKLTAMVTELTKKHKKVSFIQIDAASDFKDIIDHAEQYHLTNTTDSCYVQEALPDSFKYNSIHSSKQFPLDVLNNPSLKAAYVTASDFNLGIAPCSNPEGYVFWDSVHPTAVVHQLMGEKIVEKLKVS